MTNTTIPFMRPMRLPELLDQAIRLYRRNFFKLIAIIGMPYIPLSLIQAWASYETTRIQLGLTSNISPGANPFASPAIWAPYLLLIFVGIMQSIFVYGLGAAAMTNALANDYAGKPVGVFESFRQMGFAWLKLAGIRILFGFILFIWVIVPCIGWVTGPGMSFVATLIVLPLMPAVLVMEQPRASLILRRAWDLARSRFWWMIGFGLALSLLGQFLVTGPVFLAASLTGGLISTAVSADILTVVIRSLVSTFTSLLYLPLHFCAAIVVYFDLRVRSEGLDLALQAAREADPEASIVSLARTAPPPQGTLFTGQEILYFILIGLGIGALFALIFGGLFLIAAAAISAGGL